jgi:hypothetical protein
MGKTGAFNYIPQDPPKPAPPPVAEKKVVVTPVPAPEVKKTLVVKKDEE